MRRPHTLLATLLLAAGTAAAQDYGQSATLKIWDNTTAPHSNGITTPETEYFTLEEALRYFSMRLRSEKWSSDEAMHAALKPLLLPYTEEDGRIKNTSQDTVAWISWTPRAEN